MTQDTYVHAMPIHHVHHIIVVRSGTHTWSFSLNEAELAAIKLAALRLFDPDATIETK